MEWQPIETAPRDGTTIIVHDGREGMDARLWFTSAEPNYMGPEYAGMRFWMPLPEPPK